MDYSYVIQLPFNETTKKGAAFLFLKMDILKKYALPPYLNTVNGSEEYFSFEYDNVATYKQAKAEIDEFIGLMRMYGLSKETPYHGSHILYILLDHTINNNNQIIFENTKRQLYSRVYLLHHLMNLESFKDFDVTITGKLSDFKYQFASDRYLKEETLKYLISKVKREIQRFDPKIYSLLIANANEEQLEEAIGIQTLHRIKKTGIKELIKKLLKYLNDETQMLSNTSKDDPFSVTNEQGDFIYDLLTLFKVYEPQAGQSSKAVKHHDTIRKIIKRSAKSSEDK